MDDLEKCAINLSLAGRCRDKEKPFGVTRPNRKTGRKEDTAAAEQTEQGGISHAGS